MYVFFVFVFYGPMMPEINSSWVELNKEDRKMSGWKYIPWRVLGAEFFYSFFCGWMLCLSLTIAKDIHWTSSFLYPPTDSWGKGHHSASRQNVDVVRVNWRCSCCRQTRYLRHSAMRRQLRMTTLHALWVTCFVLVSVVCSLLRSLLKRKKKDRYLYSAP